MRQESTNSAEAPESGMAAGPQDARGERPSSVLAIVLMGFLTGTIASFFGIGGGVLLVPLLTLVVGLPRRVAAGTSLGVVVFVAASALLSILAYGNPGGQPAYKAALLVLPFSVLSSRFAAKRIDKVKTSLLRKGFAAILVFAALRVSGWLELSADTAGLAYRDFGLLHFLLLPVLGLLVGTIAALIGIGGGVLLLPAFAFLFKDLNSLEWRASSLLVVLPTSMIGFLTHRARGNTRPGLVLQLALPAVLGAVLGSLIVEQVHPGDLRQAFGVFLILVAVKLFLTRDR